MTKTFIRSLVFLAVLLVAAPLLTAEGAIADSFEAVQPSMVRSASQLSFTKELVQLTRREISILAALTIKGARLIPARTSSVVVGCRDKNVLAEFTIGERFGKLRVRRLIRLIESADQPKLSPEMSIRFSARLSTLSASLSELLLQCQAPLSPPSGTPSATPSQSGPPNATPSSIPSPVPSSTVTLPPTTSPSATSTSTPSSTPTRTPTASQTQTPTPSMTPSISPSPTPTMTPSPTPTPTATPSQTPTPSLPSETSMVTSVTRHGITWTFLVPHRVGYFINGDPFVVGQATIVNISPLPSIQSSRYINGSMINPIPDVGQGYDSSGSGFSASLFRGLNVSVGTPLVVPVGSSLISTQSSFAGGISVVERAAVLTTIPSIPTMGSFRPPYSGTSKTVKYNVAQLRTWMLQSLPVVPNTPTVDSVAGPLENVQIDHIGDWGGQAIHPRQAMDNYGRNLASQRSVAQLMTHLNLNAAQKLRLVVALVQVGIDDWGNIQNGLVNQGDGGHGNGKIGVAHYALALLGDTTEMAAAGRNPDLATRVSEYGQFQYVDNRYYSGLCTGSGFNQSDNGLPEFTFRSYPEQFGTCHAIASWTAPAQTNDYRNCCTMNGILGQLLSSRMMGIKDQWNHPAIFDYEDRYMDSVRTPVNWHKYWYVWPLHPNPSDGYHPFPANMYTTYRQNFGPVWRCTDHYSSFQCYR